MGFRALNYLHNIASRLGKPPARLAVIDRALANEGLRRKGTGRATPAPSLEEQITLLLAATTAASPLCWHGNRKEPTVKEGPNEALIWSKLPCSGKGGDVFEEVRRETLGGTLEAIVSKISRGGFERRDAMSLILNLTTDTATIQLTDSDNEYLMFSSQQNTKPVDAETTVTIKGRYFVSLTTSSNAETLPDSFQ